MSKNSKILPNGNKLKNKPTQYDLFRKYFWYWFYELGLTNWTVLYFVEKDRQEPHTPTATINYEVEARSCWIYFYGSDFKHSEEDMSALAFHELMHLVLADCGTNPKVEHSIISIFNNYFNRKNLFKNE
jgi:hypothetical protein